MFEREVEGYVERDPGAVDAFRCRRYPQPGSDSIEEFFSLDKVMCKFAWLGHHQDVQRMETNIRFIFGTMKASRVTMGAVPNVNTARP